MIERLRGQGALFVPTGSEILEPPFIGNAASWAARVDTGRGAEAGDECEALGFDFAVLGRGNAETGTGAAWVSSA